MHYRNYEWGKKRKEEIGIRRACRMKKRKKIWRCERVDWLNWHSPWLLEGLENRNLRFQSVYDVINSERNYGRPSFAILLFEFAFAVRWFRAAAFPLSVFVVWRGTGTSRRKTDELMRIEAEDNLGFLYRLMACSAAVRLRGLFPASRKFVASDIAINPPLISCRLRAEFVFFSTVLMAYFFSSNYPR